MANEPEAPLDLKELLRTICARYSLEPVAIYRPGLTTAWPLAAADEAELQKKLADGGHFLPLPKEPAALANVLETSIRDFLEIELSKIPDITFVAGTERGYPDMEIGGAALGNALHAVDIKVARRRASGKATQSRITLYTGNTYFAHPKIHFAGTIRPFDDYVGHLDVIVLYDLETRSNTRVSNVEILVHEPWRIASTQRSSTTREYIGAVQSIDSLRKGEGEFDSPEKFYKYWRAFKFKTPPVLKHHLDRQLAGISQAASAGSVPGLKPKNSTRD